MQYDDFEKQFNNPRTKGEEEQVKRLKKYSEDPAELKYVRKKLESAGYGETKAVKQDNKRPSIYRKKNPIPQRRKEDSPVFYFKKQGFFKSLINLFKSKVLIKKDNTRYLKSSFICFFKYGCGYILEDNVIQFVSSYIIKWQEKFKPVLDTLYKAGWRTESGRKFLSPVEFNMLSACSRLSNEHRLHEIIYQPDNTRYIFKVSNAFIHYYYQIVNTGIHILIKSIQNALYTYIINSTEQKFKNKPEDYANFVKEFFDGRIEKDFILPLAEAVTGEIKTKDNLKKECRVALIDTNNYRAETGLLAVMQLRAEQYKAKSEKLIKDIKKELWFINIVMSDLQRFFKIQNKNLTAIDLALSLSSGILTKQKHVLREIAAAVWFFNEYFVPLITLSFPARLQGRMEYIQLFTKHVFSEDVNNIVIKINELKPFMDHDQYSDFLKSLSTTDDSELNCATIISDICNSFYSIGEKLMSVTSYSEKKKVGVKPIDLTELDKFTIPFPDYNILHQVQDQKNEEIFTLKNRTVKEVMEHIRIFCFNFIKHFEPEFELRNGKVIKRRTIFSRLEKNQILKEFLKKLESEDDIKLPDSIDNI